LVWVVALSSGLGTANARPAYCSIACREPYSACGVDLFAAEAPVHQYHRLVYNRVPKFGSSTLIALVKLLAARNNFTLVNDEHFWPSAKRLKDTIVNLPQRTFYINHAGFWPDAPPNVGWINMVREPLDWLNTRFYYEVDESRGDDAQVTLQKRFQDTQCGCYKLEYDECVRTQHLNGCPLSTGAEDLTRFTCGPNERGCGVNHKDREEERAYHMKTAQSRAEQRFVFVGLTEEYVRSIRMLEVFCPTGLTAPRSCCWACNSRGRHPRRTC